MLVDLDGQSFLLKPHGGAGYLFVLSDGHASASWAFKRPNAKDPWGIRVSIGSLFLATSGLGAARAYIDDTLERLGIRYLETDVSIARVDYCVDILAPAFEVEPSQFVMHSSTKRRDFLTGQDIQVHGKSGRVTSVTVGGIKNRQVILYDKRAEIIAKRKGYWWDLWYVTLRREYGAAADPLRYDTYRGDPAQSRVWRVEVRAGKDLLKDRWEIRTWADLFDRFGSLADEATHVVRYTIPNGDVNRARWPNHPLWDVAAKALTSDLYEMRSDIDPSTLRQTARDEKKRQLTNNIVGTAVSMAAVDGKSDEELPDYLQSIGTLANKIVSADPERYAKNLQDAKERNTFT